MEIGYLDVVLILSGLSYHRSHCDTFFLTSFLRVVKSLILGLLLVYFMDMSWIVLDGSCIDPAWGMERKRQPFKSSENVCIPIGWGPQGVVQSD